MKVEISIDTRAADRNSVIESLSAEVENALKHYRTRLTRVEVHMRDVNGPRAGNDHRCAIEARPAGLPPLAVTHEAANTTDALKGALSKMANLLASTFGKKDQIERVSAASMAPAEAE